MKNLYCLTLLHLTCIVCNAQTHYYWSGGKKIGLDTDSSCMIVRFDSEQELRAFSATTPQARLLTAKSMALVDVREKSVQQQILSKKSLNKKMFVHKFSGTETPFYLTGDIILQRKSGISAQTILSQFQINGQIVKETSTGIIIVRLEDWNQITDVANSIYESGLVEWCHPDFITKIKQTTSDPLFSQQYALKNIGQIGGMAGTDIKAEQAWTITQSSNNIRVAVIDDGVEEHEDLAGRVLQGYTPLNPTGFGAPTTQNIPNVTIGHGQACAGIIAASHNTLGIAGIAPNVQIVPINIFHTWNDAGYNKYYNIESVQDIAAAIEYAWNPSKGNADVISNSWGYENAPVNADYITSEINNAATLGRLRGGKRLGCVVVFASGNARPYQNVLFPAYLANVIAVGAIDRTGYIWDYSCRGNALDVVTPSGDMNLYNGTPNGDIVTMDRMGSNGYETGNYTSRFGGTSAACPQVAGIAALILSVRPDLTQAQVRRVIESSCTKINPSLYPYSNNSAHPNGKWNEQVGYGLVNAYEAVKAALLEGVSISGPDILCDQASYSIGNLPQGATVAWQGSQSVSLNSTSGPSVTASKRTPNSSAYEMNGIVAKVSIPGLADSFMLYKSVVVGAPNPNLISGEYNGKKVPFPVPDFQESISYNSELLHTQNLHKITKIEWQDEAIRHNSLHPVPGFDPSIFTNEVNLWNLPTSGFYLFGGKRTLSINYFSTSENIARVKVRMHNQCGVSDWKTLVYYQNKVFAVVPDEPIPWDGGLPPTPPGGDSPIDTVPGSMILSIIYSPNPVSDELTIDFEQLPETDQTETYWVKLLDRQGKIQRETKFKHQRKPMKAKSVKFNTSSLPTGTYFLHVEGAGKVQREQIVKN